LRSGIVGRGMWLGRGGGRGEVRESRISPVTYQVRINGS
jgi:hypothetical protein